MFSSSFFCVCLFLPSLHSRCHVRLPATLWTAALQAPLFMEFSEQEYWRGCHSILQGIFPAQGSSLGLPHRRRILYWLSYQGSPLPSLTYSIFSGNGMWFGESASHSPCLSADLTAHVPVQGVGKLCWLGQWGFNVWSHSDWFRDVHRTKEDHERCMWK